MAKKKKFLACFIFNTVPLHFSAQISRFHISYLKIWEIYNKFLPVEKTTRVNSNRDHQATICCCCCFRMITEMSHVFLYVFSFFFSTFVVLPIDLIFLSLQATNRSKKKHFIFSSLSLMVIKVSMLWYKLNKIEMMIW